MTWPHVVLCAVCGVSVVVASLMQTESAGKPPKSLYLRLSEARRGLDKYYGVVVQRRASARWDQALTVWRVWKSGSRWRLEERYGLSPRETATAETNQQERMQWWFRKAENMRFVPVSVSDGVQEHSYSVKTGGPDPEYPGVLKLLSIERKAARRLIISAEDPRPNFTMPFVEQQGYPHLQWQRPVMEFPDAREGKAPAPVLLKVTAPRPSRYWIAPHQTWLVVRQEVITGADDPVSSSVIERTAKSPSGYWYPERLRVLNGVTTGDGVEDYLVDYYIEFRTEIKEDNLRVEDKE